MSKPDVHAPPSSAARVGLFGSMMLAVTLALSAMAPPPSHDRVNTLASAARKRDAGRVIYQGDGLPALSLPGGGRQTIRSVLNIDHVLGFGEYVWNDAGVAPGPVFIRVDLSRQLVSVFRGGNEIGTALVLFGTENNPTPHGILKILGKDKNHISHRYGVPMAYTLWLTTDGIAIHASDVRAGYATRGCIGVPLGFARLLFSVAQTGDRVGIVAS